MAWNGVNGRQGDGNYNDNRRFHLKFCTECKLAITNTFFQRKDRQKTTWSHPRSIYRHILDYVLVCQLDLKDILHTRVMPSTPCCADQPLVRCMLKLQFKPNFKKKGNSAKKLNVFSPYREDKMHSSKLTGR